MAKTLYHIFEDSIYQGKNNASGDTIAISFYDNDLSTINIIGGSEGKYIPDSLSDGNEYPVTYKASRITYHLQNDESDFDGNVNIKHDGIFIVKKAGNMRLMVLQYCIMRCQLFKKI